MSKYVLTVEEICWGSMIVEAETELEAQERAEVGYYDGSVLIDVNESEMRVTDVEEE